MRWLVRGSVAREVAELGLRVFWFWAQCYFCNCAWLSRLPPEMWPKCSILWALYLLTGIREAATAPGPVPWFGKWVRPLSWGQSLSEATPWQGWRKAGMGKTEEEGEVT